MALRNQPSTGAPAAGAAHFGSPTARDLRAQLVHRLQIGMFGLCAMLLLVGLANIIMDRAKLSGLENPPATVAAADAGVQKTAADPLADIGVIPPADPSAAANMKQPH